MDLGDQADDAWLLSVQRELYQWSRTDPEDSYRDVWNWITDIRNLRCAWRKGRSEQRASYCRGDLSRAARQLLYILGEGLRCKLQSFDHRQIWEQLVGELLHSQTCMDC
jgi:hypothetical protein